jgi:hypothetical protein
LISWCNLNHGGILPLGTPRIAAARAEIAFYRGPPVDVTGAKIKIAKRPIRKRKRVGS